MPRLSLLSRFALVSLVLVVGLGAVMAQQLASMISQRALRSATDAAVLTTTIAVQPLLTSQDLAEAIPEAKVAALDRAVAGSRDGTEIARIKIWRLDGELIYVADPHTQAPPRESSPEPSHELAEALEGHIEAELVFESDEPGNAALLDRYGSLLEVYVPIRYAGVEKPVGAFELYLPYQPVRNSIRADTLRAVGLLVLGLLILWAGLFSTVAGASRRLRSESRRNEHQALHDALTGLPNRELLSQDIERAVRAAEPDGSTVALVVLDLDRFREVNDTLGHRHGDLLIAEMGERLRAEVGVHGTVARLGGDEFAVLLTGVADARSAVAATERLRDALRLPLEIGDVALAVEASAGISLHPADAGDASSMLQHADVALYVAKRTHQGISVYDAAQDEHTPQRLRLLGELARGIDDGELVMHYQPQLDLSGSVRGVEALVRWQHPERGLLPPAEFIPVAERTGLIHPLTDVVLGMAVAQSKRWHDAGTPTPVAVNISTRSLLHAGFADRVLDLLAVWAMPAGLLTLEITETTIMEDPDRALAVLSRLAAAGVRLSIDDFGTGYSSLAYLKSLPVHELKIDRSFVAALTSSERDRVIVDSTVALGRRLGLDVVAEGVEDEATLLALGALGCTLAQGFYFSRPVPAGALRAGVDLPSTAAVRSTAQPTG
ncbi:MAG: bifunctional diguanylate cyclase/phosphodiesterase [Spirochaetaceae bacterium]|nr:bifunctional diguanylate cyclase/phosphodiesterase [Spirochaetaceae bacterium]